MATEVGQVRSSPTRSLRDILLSSLSFPFILSSGMGLGLLAVERGYSIPIAVAVLSAAVVPLIVWLEWINPLHDAWKPKLATMKVDALHLVLSQLLPGELFMALFRSALLFGAFALRDQVGFTLWPTGWHLAFQTALALVVGEFFHYWWHRGCHEIGLLWRLHATHHSSPSLYWLAAVRFHPLDNLIAAMLQVTPLVLLGCSDVVLAMFTLFVNIHGLFQHSNMKLKLGPLNYVLSMAELHRWHHARDLRFGNSNYGGYLIVWDIVFGTRQLPRNLELAPDAIGLEGMPNFPKTYLGQVASPFIWKRIEAANQPPSAGLDSTSHSSSE